jgi:hypothetical protein
MCAQLVDVVSSIYQHFPESRQSEFALQKFGQEHIKDRRKRAVLQRAPNHEGGVEGRCEARNMMS